VQISIIVTDDEGNTFQGETALVASSKEPVRKIAPKQAKMESASAKPAAVGFSSPIRAFMKKHSRGMGGPQKFALLVAYMAKGDVHKQVQLSDVEKQWNKMKGVIGGVFNRNVTIRAKEHEWVDSPKQGVYVVVPGWKGIFDA
jgi:hypothetical protein